MQNRTHFERYQTAEPGPRILRYFSIVVLLFLVACSSGNGGEEGDINVDNDPDINNDEEPVVQVLPSTNPTPDVDIPDDSSPIDLLLTEIALSAALPVLHINNKITTGQTLSTQEQTCSSAFDPTLGRQLKSVKCDSPWFADGSILFVSAASYNDTDTCDESLSQGQIDNCTLDSAELGFNLEWVVTTNEPGPNSPIGNLQPIAGTRISYNKAADGFVRLTESSPVTGEFDCVIDLVSRSLLTDQSRGNCQREIGRTLSRLFELRTL